jgi:phenylacetate-CoA ligase
LGILSDFERRLEGVIEGIFTAQQKQEIIERLTDAMVEIEGEDGHANERIMHQLRKSLSQSHEGLRIGVKQVERGSLPRFELKAKRLQDDRIVIGTKDERRTTA